jgi:cytochrome c peroxidase
MRNRTKSAIISALAAPCLAAGVVVSRPLLGAPGPSDESGTNHFISTGENPRPVHLTRPPNLPLSALALLGRKIFFDPTLSSSGRLSCASCHDPNHAYAPANATDIQFGGPALTRQGVRAVPSLTYLERQPNFAIGPDDEETEGIDLALLAKLGSAAPKIQKTAAQPAAAAAAPVPQGGLFWDGRADTLQQQASAPLLDPREMDGGSPQRVAAALRRAPYAKDFIRLFGPGVDERPDFLVSEALSALARFEIEAPSFHPYTSKFDFWLEGKARLSPAEARGFLLFDDPNKGNCAGCHLDRPGADGLPPLFTDHQFEALGAPRNPRLSANRDAVYYDLGLCGPYRVDFSAKANSNYCGLFQTPTLRNVATRAAFFHNGVFATLRSVVDFYVFRDVAPERVYPRDAHGEVAKFDDLPPAFQANVDSTDAPLDRKLGQAPALTPAEEADVVAFLQTLTDGWAPGKP